ncbi:MAG: GNAT family N-acetyltransferase [Archangium sp.]
MTPHPLDNPIYESLRSRHASFAVQHGEAIRYPHDVAPFLGVAKETKLHRETLEALLPQGSHVFTLGPRIDVPAGYEVEFLGPALQMVCDQPLDPLEDGPSLVPLETDAHRAAMAELTALVYPHYFRARTWELGRYFGVIENGRLAAMAGERMGLAPGGPRELSAICTHPDFLGRGLARRLLVWLSNDVFSRNEQPFLHVDPANVRAVKLYEQNGYRVRTEIPFWSLRAR